MKHITYIALMIALFAVSCTTDELVPHVNGQKSDKVQVVTRVLPFTEHDVTTRAESESTLDYIIFGTKSDNSKVCVYYNHTQNDIINIDRANDFNGVDAALLTACDIYVVANYPDIYEKILADASEANYTDVKKYIAEQIVGKKGGDYFTSIAMDVEPVVNIPESGLPRYGQFASSVNMTAGSSNPIPSGTTYTVDLVSLYAKMVFEINVDPTEEAVEFGGNTFNLEGYTVHNLPTTVDLITAKPHDNVAVHDNAIKGSLSANEINNQTFTFYVPERYFKPEKSAEEFVYPFGTGANIRPEDRDLRQRYKPLLAKGYTSFSDSYDKTNDKNATYVTITGVFTNHQGHSYDVSYNIYLGADHIGNFDVERNKQYNNTITIKGIHNSADQSNNYEAVSIDHRVNISRTLPIIVSLRRETLLDAHFEVRPLRIRKNINHSVGGGQTAPTHVKVEVSYENSANEDKPNASNGFGNWIGLERSFGDGVTVSSSDLYCVGEGSSAGKRKYFTYDLVDPELTAVVGDGKDSKPLHTSTTVYVPIPGTGEGSKDKDGNECVWIYVDECTASSPVKDAMRTATIRVSYGTGDTDESFAPMGEPIDYIINQHKLFELTYEGRTYLIEHEEEYLHNFDAETAYNEDNNKTEFEGMAWGLDGAQLSYRDDAIYVSGTLWDGLVNWLVENSVNPKYDFYISTSEAPNDKYAYPYSGFDFSKNIICVTNNYEILFKDGGWFGQDTYVAPNLNTDPDDDIIYLRLDQQPRSAVEYCYNRNKRKSDGTILPLSATNGKVDDSFVSWYMPSIDELEDIIKSGYLVFDDFHEKLYWSSQPAFNIMDFKYQGLSSASGTFYYDNVNYARATKVEFDVQLGEYSDPVSSSVVNAEQGYSFQLSWGGTSSDTYSTGKTSSYGVGYLPRSKKCRVRAVYRRTTENAVQVNNTTLKASDNENGVIDSDGWVQ